MKTRLTEEQLDRLEKIIEELAEIWTEIYDEKGMKRKAAKLDKASGLIYNVI